MMHRAIRRMVAAATVITMATLSLLPGSLPASAGGPTSVLIVAPATGRTAAAYHDDDVYTALEALLAPGLAGGSPQASDGSFGDRGTGRVIRVTWLIHDMAIWRVDQVFPDAPGGPWVLTRAAWNSDGTLSDLGSWSRSSDPTKLAAVLDELVGPPSARNSSGAGTPAAAIPARATPVAESSGPADSPWRWAFWAAAGAIGGAALVLALWWVTAAARRRASRSAMAGLTGTV